VALLCAKIRSRFRERIKALTKSVLCQTLKNLARQGSKLADKGSYIDVSDRRLQAQLTQQAKIPPTLFLLGGIFAFAGFVSGLIRSRLRKRILRPYWLV